MKPKPAASPLGRTIRMALATPLPAPEPGRPRMQSRTAYDTTMLVGLVGQLALFVGGIVLAVQLTGEPTIASWGTGAGWLVFGLVVLLTCGLTYLCGQAWVQTGEGLDRLKAIERDERLRAASAARRARAAQTPVDAPHG